MVGAGGAGLSAGQTAGGRARRRECGDCGCERSGDTAAGRTCQVVLRQPHQQVSSLIELVARTDNMPYLAVPGEEGGGGGGALSRKHSQKAVSCPLSNDKRNMYCVDNMPMRLGPWLRTDSQSVLAFKGLDK